jgi:hypothetical protein
MKKNAQWENGVNAILGIGVFLLPWLMTSSLPNIGMAAAIWNFWIVGALIVLMALLAVLNLKLWEEWTNVIAGAWLFFSPWVFGYAKPGNQLLWISLAAGLAVVVLSGITVPIARRISHNNVF